MQATTHRLFGVRVLTNCVLDCLSCEQRCYWIRSALAVRNYPFITLLLQYDGSVTLATVLELGAQADPKFFAQIVDLIYVLSDTTSALYEQSSMSNFYILLPFFKDFAETKLAFPCNSKQALQKLCKFKKVYPNIDVQNVISHSGTPNHIKLYLLKRVCASAQYYADRITFDASPELIYFCLKKQGVCDLHASIADRLLTNVHDAHKLPIKVLKTLCKVGCIAPHHKREYFHHAFQNGHLKMAILFYDSEWDLNLFFAQTLLKCPRIFNYFAPKCRFLSSTYERMLYLICPPCYHLAPTIFDMLCKHSSSPLQHDTLLCIMKYGMSNGNVALLDRIRHTYRDVFDSWIRQPHLCAPMRGLNACVEYLWRNYDNTIDYDFIIKYTLGHNKPEAFLFLLEKKIVKSQHLINAEFFVGKGHVSVIRAMWFHEDYRDLFPHVLNPQLILWNAITLRNDSVIVFLLGHNIALGTDMYKKTAPYLSEMGLVGVLSKLLSIEDDSIDNCYMHMHKSLAMDVVRILWRLAPLTRERLMQDQMFWRIAQRHVDAALFVWQQNILTNDDLRAMLKTAPKEHTDEFLARIYYDI